MAVDVAFVVTGIRIHDSVPSAKVLCLYRGSVISEFVKSVSVGNGACSVLSSREPERVRGVTCTVS